MEAVLRREGERKVSVETSKTVSEFVLCLNYSARVFNCGGIVSS